MEKPALLVIDMCQDFFKEGRLQELRPSLTTSINELTTHFRKISIPIIWVRQEFKPDLSDAFLSMRQQKTKITIIGTGGEKVLTELCFHKSDLEVIKKRYSAFFRTNLDEVLASIAPTHLVIAGVNTHACIRT